MSASLIAAEIILRVIILVFQILAIIGGIVLIRQDTDAEDVINRIGGSAIGVSTIISIYEVLMIIFALIKYVNHHARLVVDTILNSVMAVLTIIATIIVIIIAVVLFFIVLVFNGTIVVAAFALPIGVGVIYSILFIVSAISAGIIRSKLANEGRSSSTAFQPTSVMAAPPPAQTIMLVQQPTAIGQGPPMYNTGPGIPVTQSNPGTNYNYNNSQDLASYGEKPAAGVSSFINNYS